MSQRLPSSLVRRVTRTGRRVGSPTCTIRFRKHTGDTSRFAVVVSAKVDKRATERNRIRRLVREAWKQQVATLPGTYDIVCIVRPPLREMSETKVREEIARLAEQIR